MFEGFVFVLVVAGIGWCCWKGCLISKQPSTKPPSVVICPACGAKLELKESGK
jgi:hypothetical protein